MALQACLERVVVRGCVKFVLTLNHAAVLRKWNQRLRESCRTGRAIGGVELRIPAHVGYGDAVFCKGRRTQRTVVIHSQILTDRSDSRIEWVKDVQRAHSRGQVNAPRAHVRSSNEEV